MPSIEFENSTLFYDEQNPNQKEETILFLHGAAGNHMSWWQQMPHFRERYRCLALDQRGFGRSTDPDGLGYSRFVDDVEFLLDSLSISNCTLVAQSMGGISALGFSVGNPERVNALVMADTWGFFDWNSLNIKYRDFRSQHPDSKVPLVHRALARDFQTNNPEKTFLYQQIQALNPPRQDANSDTLHGQYDQPSKEDVEGLSVPVLFVAGNEDTLTPPEFIKEVHQLIVGSQFILVPDCGHSVYFEAPEVFNSIVDDFLHEQFGDK